MKRLAADSKPAVLVLDDDVLTLELYARELSGDYQVITSESVEGARACLKQQEFSALIIEPTVSGDEGWALVREIRAWPTPPAVILCSVVDDRKVGLEQGAAVFLVKPVLPTTLHHLIDQIVSKRTISPAQGMDKGT